MTWGQVSVFTDVPVLADLVEPFASLGVPFTEVAGAWIQRTGLTGRNTVDACRSTIFTPRYSKPRLQQFLRLETSNACIRFIIKVRWCTHRFLMLMRNSLGSLFISENQLSEITAPSSSDSPLKSVNTLFLDGNPLKHWSSIDAMVEWLPNINNLRAADTLLTTSEPSLHMTA
jgi:hypothetical protein